MMLLIVGLSMLDTVALLAFGLKDVVSLFTIVAPLLVLIAMAMLIKRSGYRKGILILEVAYSFLTAFIITATFFSGEWDAGYQLILVAIPIFGILVILVAVAAAFSLRQEDACRKQE